MTPQEKPHLADENLRLHGSVPCPDQASRLTGGRAWIQAQACPILKKPTLLPSDLTHKRQRECAGTYPLKTEGAPLSPGSSPLSILATERFVFAATCVYFPGPGPDSVRVCSVHVRARASSAKPRLIYHLRDDVHPKWCTARKLKEKSAPDFVVVKLGSHRILWKERLGIVFTLLSLPLVSRGPPAARGLVMSL